MSNSIKDALKKLCLKVTGKKSDKQSIQDVIDDITGNYKNGSEVIANPPVSQNAKKLTSVSIDGEKYKIDSESSSVHLYAHNISLSYSNTSGLFNFQVYTKIISSSPTLFTYDSLKQYLSSNNGPLMATGYYSDGSSSAVDIDNRVLVDSLAYNYARLYIYGIREFVNSINKTVYISHNKSLDAYSSVMQFDDTVVEIV